MASQVAGAINANRGLLAYPVVNPLDAVFAQFVARLHDRLPGRGRHPRRHRALHRRRHRPRPRARPPAPSCSRRCSGSGSARSTACSSASSRPGRTSGRCSSRPLFLLSGILYLYDSVPTAFQAILWWNPMVHVIGLMRSGFYGSYDAGLRLGALRARRRRHAVSRRRLAAAPARELPDRAVSGRSRLDAAGAAAVASRRPATEEEMPMIRGWLAAAAVALGLARSAAAGRAAGEVTVEGNRFYRDGAPWVAEGVTLVGLVSPERRVGEEADLRRGAGGVRPRHARRGRALRRRPRALPGQPGRARPEVEATTIPATATRCSTAIAATRAAGSTSSSRCNGRAPPGRRDPTRPADGDDPARLARDRRRRSASDRGILLEIFNEPAVEPAGPRPSGSPGRSRCSR